MFAAAHWLNQIGSPLGNGELLGASTTTGAVKTAPESQPKILEKSNVEIVCRDCTFCQWMKRSLLQESRATAGGSVDNDCRNGSMSISWW